MLKIKYKYSSNYVKKKVNKCIQCHHRMMAENVDSEVRLAGLEFPFRCDLTSLFLHVGVGL